MILRWLISATRNNNLYLLAIGLSPSRPRRASGAMGALQGREGNGGHPSPMGLGCPGARGQAGPGHGSPCGPLGSRKKMPRTPRQLEAFRGPSGGPGSFSLSPRLGASRIPRSSWGPAALGALRGCRGPWGRGLGPRGREAPRFRGAQGAPGVLRSLRTAAGPEA